MPAQVQTEKTPFLLSWFRSQFVSVTATGVDFLVTITLTELFRLWYVGSNFMGAFCGGIVSFTLCRIWVFNRREQEWYRQAFRYALAIGLSMMLNTGGVWFLTETFHISYILSKIAAATIVGVSVNFLVFRYFVFK